MKSLPRVGPVFSGLALLAGSCGSPTEEEPQKREFTLTRLDDVQVPGVFAEVPEAKAKAEILSGELHLLGNGSCGSRFSFRVTIDGQASWTNNDATCTWTLVGDSLTLFWTNSNPAVGTLNGPHLTLVYRTGIMCVTTPCPSQWTAEYLEEPNG